MTPPFPNSPVPNRFRRAQWKAAWSKRNGVHYIGDDVIIDLTYFQPTYNTFNRTARFDMGTDGATITISDRGYYAPFTVVSGTPTYSSTHAHSGTLSCKIDGAATEYVQWSGPSLAGTDCYRVYLYATAFPTSQVQLVGQAASQLAITTGGKPRAGGSGGAGTNMTNSIALNQWVRLEGKLDHAGSTHELKLFNDPDSTTPTETIVLSAGVGASNSVFSYGAVTGTWGSDFWIDNFFSTTTTYPGPFDSDEPVDGDTLTYTIRDYFGNTVTDGTFNEAKSWFTVSPPPGGWNPGWYRCYITGPDLDPNSYYYSYGCTNFCVIRNDANFTAMPAGNTSGGTDNAHDFVMKGVMGLGTSRLSISNAEAPTTGGNTLAEAQTNLAITKTYWSDNGIPDAERPAREPWIDFPNGAYDELWWEGTVAPNGWGRFYPLTGTLLGSQIFVTVSAGTNANTDKVEIFYPDSTTLVETYDNLANGAAAETAINAASTKVKFFNLGQTPRAVYAGPTAIGSDYRNGVIQVVQTLYPDVTRYEGPANEPGDSAETAHQMMLFQAAVHAGNANAKAIGAAMVNIRTTTWDTFLASGGGAFCDEISFHAYNAATNGDMNQGKQNIDSFLAQLSAAGAGSKALWQTESTGAQCPVYGIYHPRRARKALMETLLFEQKGVPRERNNWWYDTSQGFWDVPTWSENGDGSLEPQIVLGRVLAEETWGKPFASALDFGNPGNSIYLGNVYTGTTGTTVVLMSPSSTDGGTVTLSVPGTASATLVDGFGNTSTVTPILSRLEIAVSDTPVYLRLASGASVSVFAVNNFLAAAETNLGASATTKEIDGVSYPVISDDLYMTVFPTTGIAPPTWAQPPGVIVRLLWAGSQTFNRIVVVCGPAWQSSGTLKTFDVETTVNGTDWTHRATVSKSTPTVMEFGTDSTTSGGFLETHWDEQWIFDVPLSSSVTATGVRLNVSEAFYGGEPISVVTYGTPFGQGNSFEAFRIEEVGVFESDQEPLLSTTIWGVKA